ncbi:MAG: hypothetical protein BAJATHORv1_10191 [Candidatus Thorarchaeota archaeon]|nr:MAG: hypothetical protein BAJATHORv1_10191 [Candidatus Thorarchaeota archaeon]
MTETVPVLKSNLGLTKLEASVLYPILASGNITAEGVALLIGEKTSKVKSTLKKLIEKGYVVELEGVIPVYRAVPLDTMVVSSLQEMLDEFSSIKEVSENVIGEQEKTTSSLAQNLLESHKERDLKVTNALDEYENEMVTTVRDQIEEISGTVTNVLNSLVEQLETVLTEIDTGLDNRLGVLLSELQKSLDASQKQLIESTDEIATEFDDWLNDETTSVSDSIDGVSNKIAELVEQIRSSINEALSESEGALDDASKEIVKVVLAKSTDISKKSVKQLNQLISDLKTSLSEFDSTLGESYLGAKESLDGMLESAKEIPREQAEHVQHEIQTAIDATISVLSDISAWKKEVTGFMEVANQSVTAQLEQVSDTDDSYHEVIRTSVNTYFDKASGFLSDEFARLKSFAKSINSDFDVHVSEVRNSILSLLQGQLEADDARIQEDGETLNADIDDWASIAGEEIEKKLTGAVDEISQVLDTESSEFNSLVTNMNSRLKTAFDSIISKSASQSEAILSDAKLMSTEFESSLESTFTDIINDFATTTKTQVDVTKTLYQELGTTLNERLAQSVSTLTSHATRIQKEIDSTIEDQTGRIERMAKGIQEEFHVKLEEITRQFITLTQSTESSFNALISSQTLEATDLIGSAHTEFKNAIRTEISSLESDSLKIQEEYTIQLQSRVDEVAEHAEEIRETLQTVSSEKRTSITSMVNTAIDNLEQSMITTAESLREMSSGTIRQLGENLTQVSREFNASISSGRDTVVERIGGARDDAKTFITKSTGAIKTKAESFLSSQSDAKQRTLAETSKKLDALYSARARVSSERLENYQSSITEAESKAVKARSKSKEDIMKTLETRKNEVALAFDAASVWVESAVSNVESSLTALGSKLDNELTLVQQQLSKTSEQATENILSKGDETIEKLEAMSIGLFDKTESKLRSQATDFESMVATALERVKESIDAMPESAKVGVEEATKSIKKGVAAVHSEANSELNTSLHDYSLSLESAHDEITTLLERTAKKLRSNCDDILDKTRQNVLVANQQASRKFESLGVELKTDVSTKSYELMESIRADVATKNIEINETTATTNTVMTETTSELKQTRSEVLTAMSTEMDKSIRRWVTKLEKQYTDFQKNLDSSFESVKSVTEKSIESLEVIQKASREILSQSGKTWYIKGKEAIYSQILALANQAEESIVIASPNPGDLDLKKISKISKPRRKILIIPLPEDGEPSIEELPGWRIIYSQDVPLMAVADNKIILLGTDSDEPFSLLSSDSSYLELFHDIVGPQIIRPTK